MSIAASELVINEDGNHLSFRTSSGPLYPTVITVGDPGRVERLSRRLIELITASKKRIHPHMVVN